VSYEIRLVSDADQIAERMPCETCWADVDWEPLFRSTDWTFTCPNCGAVRRRHRSASTSMRLTVFGRDRWICHRCELPVDPLLPSTFLFGAVADHHPVTRRQGVPTIEANLRCAHYLCNNTYVDDSWTLLERWGNVPAFRDILVRYMNLPRDRTGHVYTPAPVT
jgi:hypothetical protein